MILTDEQKTEVAMATMEDAYASSESQLFYNTSNSNVRYAKSNISAYPTDNTTSPNDYVCKTNGSRSTTRIGFARVIRLMSGDTITASVKSYFTSSVTNNDVHRTYSNIATQVISVLFATTPTALQGIHGTTSDIANNTFSSTSGFNTFFNNNNKTLDQANNQKPI